MKQIAFFLVIISLTLGSCTYFNERKEKKKQAQILQLEREDSISLKIAVTPTLDCLPLFVAKEAGLLVTDEQEIRLKMYNAMMDCDTALASKKVEISFTDLVRAHRIETQGTPLTLLSKTQTYWKLIARKGSGVENLRQIADKSLAMTRYSATHWMADRIVNSSKVEPYLVFFIQVNDINVRMMMLENEQIDMLLLPEPQATVAINNGNKELSDMRKMGFCPGVIVARQDITNDKTRQKQIKFFKKVYNSACDSIENNGLKHYQDIIATYCNVNISAIDSLPEDIHFDHISLPRKEDIEQATLWLDKIVNEDAVE